METAFIIRLLGISETEAREQGTLLPTRVAERSSSIIFALPVAILEFQLDGFDFQDFSVNMDVIRTFSQD